MMLRSARLSLAPLAGPLLAVVLAVVLAARSTAAEPAPRELPAVPLEVAPVAAQD